MTDQELNLKAVMYTGMVLVAIVCLILLINSYPIIFPIMMVGAGLFVITTGIFVVVKAFLKDELW